MSLWYNVDAEDVELSEDGKSIEVYVFQNEFGAIYAEIAVDVIKKLLGGNDD